MQYIQKPRIDGKTPQEQIKQLKDALYFLIDQINMDKAEREKQGGKK